MAIAERLRARRWNLAVLFAAGLGGLATLELRLGAGVASAVLLALSLLLAREAALVLLPVFMVLPFVNYTPVPGVPGFLSCSTLLLALVVLVRFTKALLQRAHFAWPRPLDWWVLGFWLCHVPSVLLSIDVKQSLRAFIELSVGVAFYFYLSRRRDSHRTRQLWRWGLASVTLIASLLGLFQFLTDDVGFMHLFLNESNEAERLTFGAEQAAKSIGLFLHANSFSLFLTLAVPVTLGMMLEESRLKHRLILLAIAGLGMLAELTTLSRGGLLSFAAAFSSFWFAGRLSQAGRQKSRAGLPAWGVLLLILVVGGLLLRLGMYDLIVERFFSSAFEQRDAGSNFTRLINLGAALNAFLANPLFGIGPGTSSTYFTAFGGFTGLGPHNLVMFLASERGGLVLFCFIAMMVTTIRTTLTLLRQKLAWGAIGLFAALVGLLVHGLFESVLGDVFLPLFFANLALLLTYAQPEAPRRNAS